MKTYIFILTLILCFVFQPGFADNPDDDPLADSRVIRRGGGNEIIGFGGGEIVISKYFPAMEVTPTDTILKVLTYPTGAWNTSALTTINVNDNDLSDIVAAWDYGDGIVKLVALRVNPNFLNIDTLASWEKEIQISRTDPVLFHGDWWISSHPMLSSGDFTGDGKDEFVLVYWAKDAQQNLFLYLVAYDVDNELIMTEMASVMDQPVAVLTDLVGFEAIFTIYDMTTGDFNGDGKDEILLVGREAGESGGWNLFASVYSYEPGSNTLARMLKDTLVTVTDNMSELINVKVINGYLNNGDRQQAIVYYSHLNKKPESYDGTIYMRPDTSYSYMVALAFDESLSSITQSAPYLQGIGSNQTYPTTYLVLNSADITGNGFEEIFSGYSIWGPNDDSFRIYQINGELEFVEYANLDSMYCYNVDFGNIILNITGEKRSPELILPG